MIKMILTVPHGVSAETLCNVATSMVRDSQSDEDRRDYDYDLGKFLNRHCVKDDDGWTTFNYYDLKDKDVYEVNADFVDMAHIVALLQLKKICPLEMHFENSGDGKNEECNYNYFDNPVDYQELFGNLLQN